MMRLGTRLTALGLLTAATALGLGTAGGQPTGGLRFEVTVAPGLLPRPTDGRLLVVLSRGGRGEPRRGIGRTGLDAPPVLGADVNGFTPGAVGTVDGSSEIFPI